MEGLREVGLVTVVVWMGAGLALGQVVAPTAPGAIAGTAPPAKVYEVGPDVIAPELLPVQWEVMAADACKVAKEGLVSLALVVGADGIPEDISVVSPQGTTLEKMALRIVERDRFKAGTLKGSPVPVKRTAEVSIKGCFVTKSDEAGNTRDVFRLTAQPEQEFGAMMPPKESAAVPNAGAVQPLSPGVYRVGHGISTPVPLNHVEAQFSDEARLRHISGVCLISMIVDAECKPLNPRVVRALGAGLDEAAIEAVKKYRFKPAMKDGTPVPVMVTVQVNFMFVEK